MISREKALAIVRKHLKTENTVKHLLATEAIMQTLAKRFEPDKEEEWALAGLIHDLDYEQLNGNMSQHGLKTIKLLQKEKADVPQSVTDTIKAHVYNLHPEFKPKNKMQWSLFICDSLTGLIVATTLVRPDKKLASVKVKSVMKKFKQPKFAAGTRREEIALCEEKLGITLPDFIKLSLTAMQAISSDLGL